MKEIIDTIESAGWFFLVIPCNLQRGKKQNGQSNAFAEVLQDDVKVKVYLVHLIRECKKKSCHLYISDFLFYLLLILLANFVAIQSPN